jgi:hypothetical protein
MSPGLAAMTDRAAAAEPFAKAAGLLEDLAGVRLTAKRVERSAEASGTAKAAADRSRAKAITSRTLVPLPPSPLPEKLHARVRRPGGGRGHPPRRPPRPPVRHPRRRLGLDLGHRWQQVLRGHLDRGHLVRPRAPARPRPPPGVHARRPARRLARRPPRGPRQRRHRPHLRRRPRLPLVGSKKDELDTARGYFENNAPHALRVVPLPWSVHRLRGSSKPGARRSSGSA